MFTTPVVRLSSRLIPRGLLGHVVVGHWMGQRGLLWSTLAPCAAVGLSWYLSMFSFKASSWVWHHQRTAWVLLFSIATMVLTSIWAVIGVARCAAHQESAGANRMLTRGATAVVLSCVSLTAGAFFLGSGNLVETLWWTALDHGPQATVTVDQTNGRLTLTGEFAFGTTSRVDAALNAAPSIRVVNLESPGGYAIEGLALGKVLRDRGIDTVVMKYCASACITAFAAGEHRLLGPDGVLALHSAERSDGEETSSYDEAQAAFLQKQGVADWLIHGEARTPFEDIWKPGPNTLLASGLVTSVLIR